MKIQKQNNRNWIPLTYDKMAKKVFGKEDGKSALIDLLESILDFKIKKLVFKNKELLGDMYSDKKQL